MVALVVRAVEMGMAEARIPLRLVAEIRGLLAILVALVSQLIHI
jgi:hypothetical protein